MIKAERNRRSPLRILEKSIHGGVGKGNIGIIAARKGIGKTACLVHIATDQLFLDKHVIHVSFSENTNHIISWYEDIFQEIARKFDLDSAMDVHDDLIKNRIIMNFNQDGVKTKQVTQSIKSMIRDGNFNANIIVVDGYNFSNPGKKDDILEIKKMAGELGLEVWFSASLEDNELEFGTKSIPDKLNDIIDEIAILISIKPKDDYIHLQLIKDHDIMPDTDLHLKLDPKSLLIVES